MNIYVSVIFKDNKNTLIQAKKQSSFLLQWNGSNERLALVYLFIYSAICASSPQTSTGSLLCFVLSPDTFLKIPEEISYLPATLIVFDGITVASWF